MQDIIAQDPDTHGSMFVPIILRSDKTTVSVVTGHNQLCTCQLGTFITTPNMHIEMALFFLASWPSQNVSHKEFIIYHTSILSSIDSWQGGSWGCRILQVSSTTFSFITFSYASTSEAWHDGARGHSVPRWSFSTCVSWAWTIHCRLSRAMFAHICCARVVRKVSVSALIWNIHLIKFFRCMAQAKNLDGNTHFQCLGRGAQAGHIMGWIWSRWWCSGMYTLFIGM